MKRFLIIILAVALLIPCVACDGGKSKDETSAQVTDTALSETTAAEVTEPEETTLSEAELEAKRQEEIEMLKNAEGILLPIGGWSSPATELRDWKCEIDGSYDAAYQRIADAGINFMISLEEWSSESWTLESLQSCKHAGIKFYYNAAGMSADATTERIRKILESDDADALGGIYVKDEPLYDELPEVATLIEASRAALGDKKLPVFANLLPNYASKDMTGDYAEYVAQYMETSKPDILSYDFYPTNGAYKAMYGNLAVLKTEADKADTDLWAFVKVSNSQAEMLATAHVNLAFGVKGIMYFLVGEQYPNWGYTHIINYDGTTSKEYDKVKEVNRQLLNMKGVFLNYDNVGFLNSSYSDLSTGLRNYPDLLIESFGALQSMSTDGKVLAACFEKADGGRAVYIVNTSSRRETSVTLNLSGQTKCVLWSGEGLEDVKTVDSLTLELTAGGAYFVEFK